MDPLGQALQRLDRRLSVDQSGCEISRTLFDARGAISTRRINMRKINDFQKGFSLGYYGKSFRMPIEDHEAFNKGLELGTKCREKDGIDPNKVEEQQI
jgi:hypothetical protein